MRALMVVIADPVIETLAGVGKGGKERVLQKFCPDRLPEPLDLAQGHGVMRSRANVADPLALEYFLELGLSAPGSKLTTVVRENISGSAPLTDSALYHFKHCLCSLLTEQAMAHDIAGMVVDDANQVDRVHPLEVESEDVDLP
jgi:hypothetical protein